MAIPAVLKNPWAYGAFAAAAGVGTAAVLKLTDGPGHDYYRRDGDLLAKDSGSTHWLTGPKIGDHGPEGGGVGMALMFGSVFASFGSLALLKRPNVNAAYLGAIAGVGATGLAAATLGNRKNNEVPMPTRQELTERLGPEDPLRTRVATDVDGNRVTLPDEVRDGYAVIDGETWPIAD